MGSGFLYNDKMIKLRNVGQLWNTRGGNTNRNNGR